MQTKIFLSTFLILLATWLVSPYQADCKEEVYGPPNLLRTMKTPFSGSVIMQEARQALEEKQKNSIASLGTISLSPRKTKSSLSSRLSLTSKLVPARIYLPERMTIGKSAKFVVKGKSGSKVAIAMADRDEGSKPVLGKKLRLGPDRKVVAVGKIPSTGVLEVYIGTPIEGDLIGQQLYFEAALWKENDLKNAQFAQTIAAYSEGAANGVLVTGEAPKKKGIRIVPDSVIPFSQRRTQGSSLSSGQP